MTLKQIDFGSFQAPVRQPQAVAVAPPTGPGPDYRTWIMVAMAVVIVFLAFMMIGWRVLPDNDPTPDVNVDGQYVLFLKDESRPESMTIDQATVMNSAKLAKWCESKGIDMRVLDTRSQSITKMEPVWAELKNVAGPVPSMTTLNDRKAVTQSVLPSVDETIRELEQRFE